MDKIILDKMLDKINLTKIYSDNLLQKSMEIGEQKNLNNTYSKIGEILVKKNKITQEQLENILLQQSETKELFGKILLDNEIVSEKDFLESLAEQFDLSFYDQLPISDIDASISSILNRSFCLRHSMIPVSADKNSVTIAVHDPVNFSALDDIRLLLNKTVYRIVAPKEIIENCVDNVFARQEIRDEDKLDANSTDGDDEFIEGLDSKDDILDDNEEEAPVRREVKMIIRRALSEKASDIHIEPFEDKVTVRFRIDGDLKEVRIIPKKYQSSIATRIKIIGKLNIAEDRLPQDGRITLKIGGKECDVRLSTLPTKWGERIVMRILDKSQGIRTLDTLGMPEKILKGFSELLKREHGIVLVTGPTGSGKSSCLATALQQINKPDINILTVEDPVEYTIPNAGQVEVNEKAGLTFAAALRSFLRQDPDVIMIQEIRDAETAINAVQAAITGHLVFSTLHTNDTATAVTRLTDLGLQSYQIASALAGILAVRLARKLCSVCKEETEYTDEELRSIGLKKEKVKMYKLYKARTGGCPSCRNTGFSGRLQIFEFLAIDDEIRSYMLKSADGAGLKKIAVEKGMVTLKDCIVEKFLLGECNLEEAISASHVEGGEE